MQHDRRLSFASSDCNGFSVNKYDIPSRNSNEFVIHGAENVSFVVIKKNHVTAIRKYHSKNNYMPPICSDGQQTETSYCFTGNSVLKL